ncbi:MAG: UMP kinase [Candidatus Hydrogenedentota bacterium]|nr:MAG: UMP kinase [Candidatus Hydrogenedentota bacterium]
MDVDDVATSKKIQYRRVLLKLSGEVLAGPQKYGIHVDTLHNLASEIAAVHAEGVELAIVIGGGNIYRGMSAAGEGMDRVTADYMGMLATIINGLALQNALEQRDIITRVQTALEVRSVAEPFIRRKAMRHLEKNRIVILAGGTGNPYFTTDTTAALRAIELSCDIIFKATKVNGIYDDDPNRNANARKYSYVSFDHALQNHLKIMDSTAFSLCMDNKMPILVFNVAEKNVLTRAVYGESVGTLVNSGKGAQYDGSE